MNPASPVRRQVRRHGVCFRNLWYAHPWLAEHYREMVLVQRVGKRTDRVQIRQLNGNWLGHAAPALADWRLGGNG